jgi:hypothetical protein
MKSKLFRTLGVVTTVAILAGTLTVAPVLGMTQPTATLKTFAGGVAYEANAPNIYDIGFSVNDAVPAMGKVVVTFPAGTKVSNIIYPTIVSTGGAYNLPWAAVGDSSVIYLTSTTALDVATFSSFANMAMSSSTPAGATFVAGVLTFNAAGQIVTLSNTVDAAPEAGTWARTTGTPTAAAYSCKSTDVTIESWGGPAGTGFSPAVKPTYTISGTYPTSSQVLTITVPTGGIGKFGAVNIVVGTTTSVINPSTPASYTFTVATNNGATPAAPIEAAQTSASYIIKKFDPSPIVEGVNQICAIGVPGPLWALNNSPIPLAAGDSDASIPSVVAMAVESENGRVIALGHGGFLTNDALGLFDNMHFGNNIVDWLDKLQRRKMLITRGHQEWGGGSNLDLFVVELENRGYTVTRFSDSITDSALSDVGVVFIDTAWGTFMQSEMEALADFVREGGGLFLIGLGWSWKGYQGPLDEYPMNLIAEPYGIRWIDGYISDPTNNYEGQPIFHEFYPNIDVIQTIYEAFYYIDAVTSAHPSDLPSLLQGDNITREKYIQAHLFLSTATRELNDSSPQRQETYDFYRILISTYPQYFQKLVVYSIPMESTMAWIRERSYRSFIDALPLNDTRKVEIASTIGLYNQYTDIWLDFTVFLFDNSSLDNSQLNFIYSYLSLLPAGIHNLRTISVVDFLGTTSPEIPLWGLDSDVNIFGVSIGGYNENSFPSDVTAGFVDGFCVVVAHEINHVINAYHIQNSDLLKNRHDELISDAGEPHLNYLRSMFVDGFFQQCPQEFFASVANQWFTDSKKTIELGLIRFDAGYVHPINQALFFVDVYSMGHDFTSFYEMDTEGNIVHKSILVTRDMTGRIISLTIDDLIYMFSLDDDGNVMAYSVVSDASTVNLSIQPSINTVAVGDTFSVTIQAEAGSQIVTGVSTYLNFDSDYLEVQSVTPGATLPTVIQNTYDNNAGTIDYSAGKLGAPFPSGTFTVATIEFKALALTSPNTTLSLVQLPERQW